MAETTLSISELCLACGLCCTAIVHRRVLLAADELALAEELGLPVGVFEEGPGFALPCPLHHDNGCAVYLRRPQACAQYQCELMQRCLRGEVTLAAAVELVTETRRLLSAQR